MNGGRNLAFISELLGFFRRSPRSTLHLVFRVFVWHLCNVRFHTVTIEVIEQHRGQFEQALKLDALY